VDDSTRSGDLVEIEQREPAEVLGFGGTEVAPDGAGAINPAFDVTPHSLITAIVTDARIIRP
jgi:methylthioribose-1-phosphate isomerase